MERDSPVRRYHFQNSRNDPPSVAVVLAVSQLAQKDPDEVGPLRDVIDPDALDDLFGPKPNGQRRHGGRISFTVDDYDVTVDGNGEIVIRPES